MQNYGKNEYIVMWYKADLPYTFVDCKQVYESVCRTKILECLAQCNVPAKLKGLIELTRSKS
jgi:hypothetical protein